MSNERYLLSCMRYIELNPVRAGMVTHPEAYPWSSWHANVGTRRSVLVTPHPEYLALGSGADERYTCYRALVLQHETEEMTAQLRDATQQNAAFGSPRFAREIEQMLGRDVSIKPRGRPKNSAKTE